MTASLDELDAAWSVYADRIKSAGEMIVGAGFPEDLRLRSEGYRYVGRLSAQAHQLFIEFADTSRPTLFARGGDITAYGATNVDNNNSRCMVDPSGVYRVTGNVAGALELIMSVYEGEFVFGKPGVLAEICLADLNIGEDGQLDLQVGGTEREHNWMPLGPDATYFGVRQFISDWENDPIADLGIERIDVVPPVDNLSSAGLIAALDRAATWVEANVRVWNLYSNEAVKRTPTNRFDPPKYAEGGAVNMLHGGCRWSLEPEQALVITLDPGGAKYWSIQNYVLHWLQPLDFVDRVTSLNQAQSHVSEDGLVRFVLSHRDPGVHNWLDTSGLPEGLCSGRWVRPGGDPAVSAQLVDLADVRDALPTSTPTFGQDERMEQVAARRRGANRRFRR